MEQSEQSYLEAFVVDNRDLEQLENLLAEFNVFEALGAVRQEVRHSDFLSFLLSPNQNHGLGDEFLKRFLKRVLIGADGSPVSAIEIDVADLSAADVRREWRNIDILIHSPENHVVVAIENKVDSSEHSGQLKRYRETIESSFEGHLQVLIFLTPEGVQASDEAWISFSYDEISDLITALTQSHQSTLGPDVLAVIRHYAAMLRRHIVSDSQIVELCQKIYKRHKTALELIYEHRPDLQNDVAEYLGALIAESGELKQDHSSKSYVRFFPPEWDTVPALRTSKGWTRSGRILLFEFWNFADSLAIKLMLGPGPEDVRTRLHTVAKDEPKRFTGASKSMGKKYASLYSQRLLSARDYEDAELDDLRQAIEAKWKRFLEGPFPAIRQAVDQIDWEPV